MSSSLLLAFLMTAFCMIVAVVSERCIEVLVSVHSICCRCFTIVIKQGLFLVGDMATFYMNIIILQIFLSMNFFRSFLLPIISSKLWPISVGNLNIKIAHLQV